MPKTNDAVQGWHTGFEATLDAVTQTFSFFEAQHRKQATAEVNTAFAIAGLPLLDENDKFSNPMFTYLRGLAHNISSGCNYYAFFDDGRRAGRCCDLASMRCLLGNANKLTLC